MTRHRSKPVEPVPAVIRCAEPHCAAVTEVEPKHAGNLTGRWRCRQHYLGTLAAPTTQETR